MEKKQLSSVYGVMHKCTNCDHYQACSALDEEGHMLDNAPEFYDNGLCENFKPSKINVIVEGSPAERLSLFMDELARISAVYGVHLWACSCCNAINAVDTRSEETLADCLLYNKKKQQYTEYGD